MQIGCPIYRKYICDLFSKVMDGICATCRIDADITKEDAEKEYKVFSDGHDACRKLISDGYECYELDRVDAIFYVIDDALVSFFNDEEYAMDWFLEVTKKYDEELDKLYGYLDCDWDEIHKYGMIVSYPYI